MDPVSYVPLVNEVDQRILAPPVPSAPPLESSNSDNDQINIVVIQRPQDLQQNCNWGLYCGYLLIIIIVIIVLLYTLTHLIKPKN
jgi:hypothetical protein